MKAGMRGPLLLRNNVIFLDRDGVINQDSPDYIKNRQEFIFIPGSISAICELCDLGFDIIIITNQSGLGRHLITPSNLNQIHDNLVREIRARGGRITDIFFCPHRPQDNCKCRKPLPGMLFKAQKKYAIDLATAIMVGDSAKDIECGRNAGVGKTILVKTGNFRAAQKILSEKGLRPDYVASDLLSAAKWIRAQAGLRACLKTPSKTR
jgi:D-glycero-D-manno-heptose 1,7-bisphosphate phosphatase